MADFAPLWHGWFHPAAAAILFTPLNRDPHQPPSARVPSTAMSLENQLLAYLAKAGPTKARDIATHFGLGHQREINPHLYGLKNARMADIDAKFRWSITPAGKLHLNACAKPAAPTPQPPVVSFPKSSVTHESHPHRKESAIITSPAQSIHAPPSASTAAEIVWTSEQSRVINAPATHRLLVEAGPGTGKSETLVARLKNLVGPGGLNSSEVLVLSFSVAAVKELKTRIERARAAGDTATAFIDLRTFDSFASRFLRRLVASNELQDLDYDSRILRATQELKTNSAAALALAGFRHVLLDEIQDLVGVRADFALELLRVTKPGFTLFGDSAQGIYDFTIESGTSRTTSGELVEAIRTEYPDLDDQHRFTKNFRVGGNPQLESIAVKGRTLLIESPDKARAFLEKEFGDLTRQGSTGNPAIQPDLLHGATCVVCRTNGQVLRLAGQLHEKGIPFQIARDKNEFLPPVWLGRVFLGWPDTTARRQEFLGKAQSVLTVSEAESLKLWSGLVSSFGPPKAVSFTMTDLRAAISDGAVMPEHPSYERNTNAIHISTIHRSKGREFANVIVVMRPSTEAGPAATEDAGPAVGEDRAGADAEPRVLFVALTRARNSVHRMDAQAKGIWMPQERWIRSHRQRDGFTLFCGIQAGLHRDVDVQSFAVGEPAVVRDNQDRLLTQVRPGTPVELRFDSRVDGWPLYLIVVDNVAVGRMSADFGWAVWHTMKNLNGYKPNKFPIRFTQCWVKEIVTVVGDIGDDRIDRSLRHSGLWLALTIEGLGNSEWK